ncbi:Transcription factor 25 [Tetrabaena socialis]|uniref:Transcription factor 25 n=1 Tax=Tetrabaena socialis TaxID=47790 RepID=A0A2J8A967_9CHLO|nr:Transcription factor 25 [Tetrabaena socialis]|eukprot:PNH09023.1 Transcription factor 25 [Tetrabaena socialis]
MAMRHLRRVQEQQQAGKSKEPVKQEEEDEGDEEEEEVEAKKAPFNPFDLLSDEEGGAAEAENEDDESDALPQQQQQQLRQQATTAASRDEEADGDGDGDDDATAAAGKAPSPAPKSKKKRAKPKKKAAGGKKGEADSEEEGGAKPRAGKAAPVVRGVEEDIDAIVRELNLTTVGALAAGASASSSANGAAGGAAGHKAGVPLFRYLHSATYKETQARFYRCQASYDPATIAALLQQSPYHVDSLLAMHDLYRHMGENTYAEEMLERALWVLEAAWHASFQPASAACRLDYGVEENRPMFGALFRHVQPDYAAGGAGAAGAAGGGGAGGDAAAEADAAAMALAMAIAAEYDEEDGHLDDEDGVVRQVRR